MALSVKTGNFSKSGSVGTQAVTGVGFIPKVLILWTSYLSSSDTITTSYNFSHGMTTGPGESWTTSIASQGGVGTSNNARRCNDAALTVVTYNAALAAEADISSFDADGFTLDWSTNDGFTPIVHYLAIGGSDLTGQKVFTFTNANTTGNQSFTGSGFKPDVLMISGASATVPPEMSATQSLSLSMLTAAPNYAAISIGGDDAVNTAAADYDTFRVVKTDSALIQINPALSTLIQATLTSMDANGFTLNFGTAGISRVFGVLALKGIRAKVGSFTSASTITGVGFQPSAVAFLGTQRANTTSTFNLQGEFGVTTGASANQGAGIVDSRIPTGGGNTDASGVDSTGKCYTRISTGPPGIQTQAALSSFDSDGFTLSWSSGTVTDIIGYLALGAAPTITTVAASTVTTTTAQLNGTVNPMGSNATYYFQWGLTTAYGNTTAAQGPTNGSVDLTFNQGISGLTGNTQYNFRAVVEATGTTIYGSNQSFTTPGVDRAVMVF